MAKRIIVVHGRATKPRREEKERLVRQALIHGLNRVNGTAAGRKIENQKIQVDLAYYGDVNNAILWAETQHPRKKFDSKFLQWPYSYETDGSYDDSMRRLFSIETGDQNKKTYHALKRREKDKGAREEIADFISPIAELLRINKHIVNRFLPDLGAYFQYRAVGSIVRDRLQRLLVPAMQRGDDICLIAHSMGSIIAYDVLWKVSRMSEYREIHDKKVNLFVTLGSPLGEEAVKSQLYDCDESDDGRYPTNIVHWCNFSAEDDYVSHDERIADDYTPMKLHQYLATIKDHFIYTFWIGRERLNPHKLYGYLDNHKVAGVIGEWIG
ncbi:MAG TPA: hypothetical protein VK138_14750 [Acidiferrobacterales bacterium]|nr:hypothetical protein [Acidiferrobacterales bacterium]